MSAFAMKPLLDLTTVRFGELATGQRNVDLRVIACILPLLSLLCAIFLRRVCRTKTTSFFNAVKNAVELLSNIISSRKFFANLKSASLPPGPPSWPIFGYLPGLPKIRAWEVYNGWSKVYGSDVIHVPTFRRHIIILNSADAVFECLQQRGNIYSDRPRLVMLQDLMDLGQSTGFARYGGNWRHHRKIYTQQMNINSVKNFRHSQVAAARDLVGLLLESPESFAKHLRHFSAGVVMNITYGYEIARENDELVQLTETTSRAFSEAAQPGYYMVDNFPILRHVPSFFPFIHFKTIAAEVRERSYQTSTVPFRRVIQGMKSGSFKRCFVSDLLGDMDSEDFGNPGNESGAIDYGIRKHVSENFSYAKLKADEAMEELEKREDIGLVKNVARGIFAAGTSTTASVIQAFILAMILYPSVQQTAQKELDRVLGGGRLPTFEDRASLPYSIALCQEILRWFPVAPTALPHVTTEENVYKGYRIPKGSVVFPNARNILHDPQMYPNPQEFKPERFLPDENGQVLARDPGVNGAFGFGRRICAGRNLAEASIWISVVSILAVFEIRPALDKGGKPIDVSSALRGTPGLFNHPLPFECCIAPRSKIARRIILDACTAATV